MTIRSSIFPFHYISFLYFGSQVPSSNPRNLTILKPISIMFKNLNAADASMSHSVDATGKLKKFRWRINNFSRIIDKTLYSEVFTVDGNKWRILIYPKGNNVDHLSVYLVVADSATLPWGWRRYAQFRLAVINQIDRKTSVIRACTHVFTVREVDWGFTSFLSLTELHNPRRGFLVNDACLVEAYVSSDATRGLISHNLMVENDLALCNLKTKITRPVEITASSSSRPSCRVVAIGPDEPTKEDMNTFFTSLESELWSSSIVISREEAKEALAKLEAALNMALISFHDPEKFSPVNEAFKILASVGCSCTNLTIEQKNELLAMGESLKQLVDRAVKAVEDKNRLTEKESIKKTVTSNLERSLVRYKEVESEVKQVEQKLTALLEQVEEAQKKRKSMLAEQKGIFKSSKKMKTELEALSKECVECEAEAKFAEDEEKNVEAEWVRMKYFISSIKEDVKRALGEKHGGEEAIGLKEQEEEQKRRLEADAQLYTVIKVVRDEDLVDQIGRVIYFDLADHEKVRSFRIRKQMTFNVFKEEIAKEFGIPVQYQRFWLWEKRQNHTYRPNRLLTYEEEARSVGQLREISNEANNAELKVFLEVELGPDLRPVAPPKKTKEDILLFFKLYDPYKEELCYIGRMFVKGSGKPKNILARIEKMAGFDLGEKIQLYEEIKFEHKHIDKNLTFRTSQLQDGDIICLQKFSDVVNEQCRYPDVTSFLAYVHNRRV